MAPFSRACLFFNVDHVGYPREQFLGNFVLCTCISYVCLNHKKTKRKYFFEYHVVRIGKCDPCNPKTSSSSSSEIG